MLLQIIRKGEDIKYIYKICVIFFIFLSAIYYRLCASGNYDNQIMIYIFQIVSLKKQKNYNNVDFYNFVYNLIFYLIDGK